MDKAIIWGRVSTIQQEVESQVKELVEMALRDGYKESNLTIIKSEGASAIKQNELYVQEVNKLISTLDNDNSIKCVYVWEVSRLARVELPFYTMKDYFVRNKIQLIVKTPEIHLLDKNGNVDQSAEVILNLFMTIAKQEMEIKQKRMTRARKEKQSQGKWGGGHDRFGYTTDKDKNIIVNEEEAEIVRNIFHLYLDEDMGATDIYRYYRDRGIFKNYVSRTSGSVRINNILRNKLYAGVRVNSNIYPAIVPIEYIERAIKKLESRRHAPKKTKNIYLCKNVLVCSVCGHHLSPHKSHAAYRCSDYGHFNSVNMNAADHIVWTAAIPLHNEFMSNQALLNETQYKETIENNEISIQAAQKAILDAQKKAERAANLYVEGVYSKEQFNAKNKELQSIIKERENEITKLENANHQLNELLNTNEDYIEEIGAIGYRTETIEDDDTRQMIIEKVIDRVTVEIIDKHTRELVVYNKMNLPLDMRFRVYSSGRTLKVYQWVVDQWLEESTPILHRYFHI